MRVFVACASQWQHAGIDGQPVGLRYEAVEAVMRMMGIEDPADTFARLRVLEAETLRIGRQRRPRGAR